MTAQPNWNELGYEIAPRPGLRYEVSQNLLVDYAKLLLERLPALDSLTVAQKRMIEHQSVLITEQAAQISLYERQEVDLERLTDLYEAEIDKRERIEALYARERRALKWWRRGAVATAVGLITLAVLR